MAIEPGILLFQVRVETDSVSYSGEWMTYRFELGNWTRKVTTTTDEAQIWFDRGLNWTYGFNHEEAVECFRKALSCDPDCAMAWWGIAYTSGPYYNRPWDRFADSEIAEELPVCHSAAVNAANMIANCNAAESVLIRAIGKRYRSEDELDRSVLNGWHEDFMRAMEVAHSEHPHDLDIAAIFAEAALTCHPRQHWITETGEPNEETYISEAMNALEAGLSEMNRRAISHPGLLHFYIHAMEMSAHPETALEASDQLRNYAKDEGHLQHMPAHIYTLCGDYQRSIEQSKKAVAVNEKFLEHAGTKLFYTTSHAHDLHLFTHAAMLQGHFGDAIRAAQQMCALACRDSIESSGPFMATILDGYAAMRTHVLVRFGKWELLVRDPPVELYEYAPISWTMHLYGQGIAHAAEGRVSEADVALFNFRDAILKIPEEMVFLNNSVRDVMRVGEAMLDGEIAYRNEDYTEAFKMLRVAVELDDKLNYTEPWAWMHPPRHALGALLAEQGQWEEAEEVYRADLGLNNSAPRCCRHPDNVWALFGLLECVERTGGREEAVKLRKKVELAQLHSDIEVVSACFCRRNPDTLAQ